jgi:large subunit ribosomal protein L25
MAEIPVPVEAGRRAGSSASRRLRAEGKIPGVVYGHGIEPLSVTVDARALRSALTTEAGLNALLALQVDGQTHLTLAREIQRHPVRGTVSHVDFQVVRRDEVVTSEVPISLVGDATAVHREDGLVDQQLFSLAVQAVPTRIPNVIEVDVSELTIGEVVKVGQLTLPEGVSTEVDPEAAVVVGQPPQVSAADLVREGEEPEAAEAEAGAEAAPEGAAPEGAAPTAGEGAPLAPEAGSEG